MVISGSGMGKQMWEPRKNDRFNETRSVLMGAVLTKSFDTHLKARTHSKLAWILSANATVDDAFSEHHIPLMQCCVDVFSLLANTMIRFRGPRPMAHVVSGAGARSGNEGRSVKAIDGEAQAKG